MFYSSSTNDSDDDYYSYLLNNDTSRYIYCLTRLLASQFELLAHVAKTELTNILKTLVSMLDG